MKAGPEIRALVRFERVNLNDGYPGAGTFDLVFCRNVLIYFNNELQERVQRLFLNSLENFGILGLGKKETVRYTSVTDFFEELDAEERLYRRVR